MQGALSAISGKFGSALILGTFFPSVVFVALVLAFVFPLLPDGWLPFQAIERVDANWRVIGVVLLPVVIAGILYNLNTPIIRFFEGYPWIRSWIGRCLVNRQRARLRASSVRRRGLFALLGAFRDDPRRPAVLGEWSRHGEILSREYPRRESSVLPTRLGNVIRAFEDYPADRYGMDAVELWPRLVAQSDKEFLAALDDAKAALDFMLNSALLSGLLLLISLTVGMYYGAPLALPDLTLWWWLEMLAFGISAYLFYLGAVSLAGSWGAGVKSAFDLYRWKLLQQLGHRRIPSTRTAEIALWQRISAQMTYVDTPTAAPHAYSVPPTSASGEPASVRLVLARGTTHGQQPATITIRVRNVDPDRVAGNVVVVEEMSEGSDYVWNSALVDEGTVEVSGTNPYEFAIGDIEPRGQRILTYRATRSERKV